MFGTCGPLPGEFSDTEISKLFSLNREKGTFFTTEYLDTGAIEVSMTIVNGEIDE